MGVQGELRGASPRLVGRDIPRVFGRVEQGFRVLVVLSRYSGEFSRYVCLYSPNRSKFVVV